MITIIAGSRGISDITILTKAIEESKIGITSIVSGGARGVDKLAEDYARMTGIPIEVVYANWFLYGPSAGAIRNQQMADKGEALIALWDGTSKGTRDMITKARRKGLLIHVKIVR